jgi:hypothetical protein
LRKVNKSANDFSVYSDIHLISEDKFINNEASYGFAVMGRLKAMNSYTYEYYVTNEKPTGFIYVLSLSGKAAGKTESVQKALEKKLSSYNLMKKGYVNGLYTSVYKSDKNIIITASRDSSTPMFYILNRDYEISYYLNKIVEQSAEASSNYDSSAVDTTAVEAVDTVAASADTTAYYGN